MSDLSDLSGLSDLADIDDIDDIVLQLAGLPPCPRCGEATLLRARFAHTWKNSRGEDVTGNRESLLCPACERGAPAADQLLALFAVDGQPATGDSPVFGGLVAAWVESVRHRTVDTTLIAETGEEGGAAVGKSTPGH